MGDSFYATDNELLQYLIIPMILTSITHSEDRELFSVVSMTVQGSSEYVIFVNAIDRFAQVKYMPAISFFERPCSF